MSASICGSIFGDGVLLLMKALGDGLRFRPPGLSI